MALARPARHGDRRSGNRRGAAPLQGRGVGGGSNINGMAADRGTSADYDDWRSHGARGWGWNDVLPYFRKLERDLDAPADDAAHGQDGPIPVRRLARASWSPFAAMIADVLQRRGYPAIADSNSDFRDGVSAVPMNSLATGRVSAAAAYLTAKVRRRPNLSICANAQAERVIFEGNNAVGVVATVAGRRVRLRGRKTILSCGALQSPLLLLRSGIGPAAQLARHGIDPVRDLPGVGKRLYNHVALTLATHLEPAAVQSARIPWAFQNWLRYSSRLPGCDDQDMMLIPVNKTAWHALGRRVAALTVILTRPCSTGSIELSDSDPAVPCIRFNPLADDRDRARLMGGVRFVLTLLSDPAARAMTGDIFLPGGKLVARLSHRRLRHRVLAAVIAPFFNLRPVRRLAFARRLVDPAALLADDARLRELVEANVQPVHHWCGTCPIGDVDDADAVVDGKGQVHGVDGLHVVDASIFPTLPRACTHLPVLMTAEKIADAIRTSDRIEADMAKGA